MKTAWIDHGKRILSFTVLAGAQCYRAEESPFWKQVLLLMHKGYRVQ